jgi:hypothetical protein
MFPGETVQGSGARNLTAPGLGDEQRTQGSNASYYFINCVKSYRLRNVIPRSRPCPHSLLPSEMSGFEDYI